jgi:hypothetical protein
MKEVMAYFEMPIAQFRKEWGALTDEDKAQLKSGITSGTYTY